MFFHQVTIVLSNWCPIKRSCQCLKIVGQLCIWKISRNTNWHKNHSKRTLWFQKWDACWWRQINTFSRNHLNNCEGPQCLLGWDLQAPCPCSFYKASLLILELFLYPNIGTSYILIHYVRLSVWRGFWGVGEREAGEAMGDWCQSVTGVGPPRFSCTNRLHKAL